MGKERIIKGLECCQSKSCNDCPYKDEKNETYSGLCQHIMENDAFTFLKEQEAELSYRKAKAITHTATKLDDATCPSCGNVVGEKIRTGVIRQSVVQVRWDYCRFYGQKLDWERLVKRE